MRAIDIMKSGYSGYQPEIFREVAAHPFAEKLFPAISILGKSRISI
ncbi:MAG: hypothetical protein MZV63_15380 [Marinilabiliales bacterium]|nr:hypothetical protein [Marinilabiliales bacterium]